MCGIAGYIGKSQLSQDYVAKCLPMMRRRGPDASGTFHHSHGPEHHVSLLHSRLCIIDLDDRANQPFEIASKVLVCNGELYNYIELKRELSALGYCFTTESDTEVLLQMIIHFGWQGLDKCEGMWAFALYDKNEGSLTLSRDRFGEKPLYFYQDQHGFYFGSEIKFISALKADRLKVNHQHIYRYMVNGFASLYKGEDTFFRGVQEVSPASVMLIKPSGTIKKMKYWQPSFEQDESLSYDDAVAGVQEKLVKAVKLRLRADVPLAFCMSGGVDSNSLISIAKRMFNYDVHGFTIINEDERYEESAEVECAVKELGIRHTSVPITEEGFLDNIRELILQHDAPVYTITYYVHWLLMKHVAQEGYRISVSGTGADELLTGYYENHNCFLYEMNGTPLFDEALAAWKKHIAPIVRNPFFKNPYLFIDEPNIRDHIYSNSDMFAEYLIPDWREDYTESHYTDSLLRNRMLNELFSESVPVILHEDDLNAMYYSIENRSPFLDRNLFEFCSRIPTRYLIRDGYAKVVLRDAMKGIAPSKILLNRRKVGFNAPIFSFLNIKNNEVRSWLLDDGKIFEHVHRGKIEELIRKEYLPNSESKFLFYFLCAKVFLEEFDRC